MAALRGRRSRLFQEASLDKISRSVRDRSEGVPPNFKHQMEKKKPRHTRRRLPLDRKCLHVNRKQSYILPIHISQTASVVRWDQMQEQKLEIKLWSNFNIILKVWMWAGFVGLFKFFFLDWGKFTLQRTSGGVSSWSKLMTPLDPLVLVQAQPLPTAQSSSPGNWWWPPSSIISFLEGFPFYYLLLWSINAY